MKRIEEILERHRHWLSQSGGMIAQELEYLEEDLACDSLEGLNNVSDSLGMLAVFHGIQGEVAICAGDISGWEEVSRALTYRYWALMLRAKAFSKTRFLHGIKKVSNLTNQLSNSGCLLAGFIAADRHDLAESVADVLVGMLTVDGVVDSGYLKKRRFEPFMLWLYSIYSGGTAPIPIDSMNLGIYQKVVESWADEQKIVGVLEELCQYHLANSEDKGGAWDPEFKDPPFDLLPLEVVAIFKVRQQIGLMSPAVTSPLLSVETAAVDNLIFKPDDIAVKVEAAYRNFFG
ncbi:hypothetical protein [Pseudoxanthomonas sp. JBR18]|uniref:hypothetical protein n=1 Tax=Pseudoxanthomonas sp. JBR18 TaxID=2969308 RepID=UPI002305B544|nr:hypothetical protein [Pseudoxanthomonas sp. JBR18]WCE05589.1 hypothetical protein PJ250_06440 [Pseudoxanthomonas sp. JBR18]